MARDAGARKVYLASAAPPVRFPNVYGIDMPTSDELIAHDRSDRGDPRVHRRRRADLPGRRGDEARRRRAQPEARRLRGLVLRRRLHHRRRQRRRASTAMAAQRRAQGDEDDAGDRVAPRAAERRGARLMAERARSRASTLPAGARLDTLAVREGLPRERRGARTRRRCSSPAASSSPTRRRRRRASPTRRRRSSTRASPTRR